jgi:hypothetical protein
VSKASIRSPGERAFDQCFYPVPLFVLLFVVRSILSPNDLGLPAFPSWGTFSFGIMLSAYWLWAFYAVATAWHDPFARVLRFSSLAILALAVPILLTLLQFPSYAES